jgi:hypothetical protein
MELNRTHARTAVEWLGLAFVIMGLLALATSGCDPSNELYGEDTAAPANVRSNAPLPAGAAAMPSVFVPIRSAWESRPLRS